MLRTLIAGALTAIVGSRLLKMNRDGKFDETKARIREKVANLREDLAESPDRLVKDSGTQFRPARPPRPSASTHRAASDEVSRPPDAAPWPADTRAVPKD